MNKELYGCALALCSSFVIIPAQAQTFCGIIARYFTDPPSEFLAERGVQTDQHTWDSSLSYPNAKCRIRISGNRYLGSCLYNQGATADVAVNWYKTMEVNIDKCIGMLPEPSRSDYKKENSTDTDNYGTKTVETSWDDDEPEASYSITIRGYVYTNGHIFNSMDIVYKKN